MVLFRYARKGLFRSRFQTGLFVACFFYPVVCLCIIYLSNNLSFLEKMGSPTQIIAINNRFFFYCVNVQGALAFILTAFTGPGLISPDLANGALPLYFCRPFSRAEYVLGKASVLAILLSQITWIPELILFAVQGSLAGPHWVWDNRWIAASIFVSSVLWIAILSLMAMALSAWVKWRIVAGALLLAVMFFGAGFAGAVNAVLRTQSGHYFNLPYLMNTVWSSLFQIDVERSISVGAASTGLLIYCAICFFLLMRKVRAYEVVA